MFDAIAFAGGGNRCYWQGGFYEAVADRLALPPKLAVGVSAGAFACIYSILGIGPRVRKQVLAACGPHRKNFDFSGWRAGGPLCPVGPMYRALLDELIDNAALARLKQLTDLHIAVARLPFGLPPLARAADADLSAGARGAGPDLRPALPPDRGQAVRCDQSGGDPGRLRAGTPGWPSVCGGRVAPGRKAMHFAQCCTAA